MKRFLRRILIIFLVLMFAYQQFCYSDVVMIDPADEIKSMIISVGFIAITVLIISVISYIILKKSMKKQNLSEFGNVSVEELEKKKSIIQLCFYICAIVLSLLGLKYLELSDEISSITFFIPIALFFISIIARLIKHKKISNIICIISVVLVCTIAAWIVISNKIVETYNKQFLQYIEKETSYWGSPTYVTNMEGLINSAIKNNKSGRKTTLIYLSKEYTSPNELEQLLEKINTNKTYNTYVQYDYYDGERKYIEYITLISHDTYDFYSEIRNRLGSGKGANVREYLRDIKGIVSYYDENGKTIPKLTITHILETGEQTNIEASSKSFEELNNLIQEINYGRTYDVNIQVNADDVYSIIIRRNNIENKKNGN